MRKTHEIAETRKKHTRMMSTGRTAVQGQREGRGEGHSQRHRYPPPLLFLQQSPRQNTHTQG